jgi:hypothetical protein
LQSDRLQGALVAPWSAEQEPITCHRAILISKYLKNTKLDIRHILKTSDLELHECLEQRLLKHSKINKIKYIYLFDLVLIENILNKYIKKRFLSV